MGCSEKKDFEIKTVFVKGGEFLMGGNIWEFCSNAEAPYPCDSLGKIFDSKVSRGLTFGNRSQSIRVQDRNARDQTLRLRTLGFRLAK